MTLAAGSSGVGNWLRIPYNKDFRTSVLGNTEYTLGWKGIGKPTMIDPRTETKTPAETDVHGLRLFTIHPFF
jgi:hypothetical protein